MVRVGCGAVKDEPLLEKRESQDQRESQEEANGKVSSVELVECLGFLALMQGWDLIQGSLYLTGTACLP